VEAYKRLGIGGNSSDHRVVRLEENDYSKTGAYAQQKEPKKIGDGGGKV